MHVPAIRGLLIAVLTAAGCGDDDPTGARDGGDATCRSATDCDDGLFCNGAESCEPSDPASSDRGCVVGDPPCLAMQTCDDATDRCVTACAATADADGDGHDAAECGGDDCDDSDAMRFPGNAEVCDAEGHDEDCDPTTFGDRDADGDGYVDAACCDGSGGSPVCGDDCDDEAPAVHPNETEVCNEIDDDCDGDVDEALLGTFYPDADRDGAGDDGMPTLACREPAGFVTVGGDCDDSDAGINPDAVDTCDGVDTDCDGTVDEAENCGALFPGAVAACVSGTCELVSCRAGYGNCDTDDSNGCEEDINTNSRHCGSCGNRCETTGDRCAAGACTCSASGRPCGSGEACCGGLCVDVLTSSANCGTCSVACSGQSNHCVGGICRCGDGPPCPTAQSCTASAPTDPRGCG